MASGRAKLIFLLSVFISFSPISVLLPHGLGHHKINTSLYHCFYTEGAIFTVYLSNKLLHCADSGEVPL
jgi:hypothetical protein